MARLPHVWFYGRVSTAQQAAEGLSPEAQQSKMEAWTRFRFPDSVDSTTNQRVQVMWPPAIDLAISSTKPFIERPAGKRLWAQFEPGDHLVVVKFDRLFRSVADFDYVIRQLGERNITLHLLDLNVDASTATGKMILGIMAVIAQFEREVISERTRDTLDYKRMNNLPVGRHLPYGYSKEGEGKESRYVPNIEERNLCRLIVDLIDKKQMSQRNICMYLWTEGLKLRGSDRWSPFKIEKITKAVRNNFPLTNGYMDDSGHLHQLTNGQ